MVAYVITPLIRLSPVLMPHDNKLSALLELSTLILRIHTDLERVCSVGYSLCIDVATVPHQSFFTDHSCAVRISLKLMLHTFMMNCAVLYHTLHSNRYCYRLAAFLVLQWSMAWPKCSSLMLGNTTVRSRQVTINDESCTS
jgi:hypothetical protein